MKSTDENYGSLAYDGAPLLRVPLCVSRVFLVNPRRHYRHLSATHTHRESKTCQWTFVYIYLL